MAGMEEAMGDVNTNHVRIGDLREYGGEHLEVIGLHMNVSDSTTWATCRRDDGTKRMIPISALVGRPALSAAQSRQDEKLRAEKDVARLERKVARLAMAWHVMPTYRLGLSARALKLLSAACFELRRAREQRKRWP